MISFRDLEPKIEIRTTVTTANLYSLRLTELAILHMFAAALH